AFSTAHICVALWRRRRALGDVQDRVQMETADHHQREDELRSHYPDDNAGGHKRKKKSSLSSCQTAIPDQDENRELNQWVPTTSSTTCSTKCLHGLVELLEGTSSRILKNRS
ncbi:unnamed protein product, partial [Urochloa humidicola]